MDDRIIGAGVELQQLHARGNANGEGPLCRLRQGCAIGALKGVRVGCACAWHD